jgi:uncharacterized protein (DUF486 family)
MFDGSQVRARHILLTPPSGDPRAVEQAKADLLKYKQEIEQNVAKEIAKLPATADALAREQARTKLLEDEFGKVAREKSACPSKQQGGDVDFFPRGGSMVEAFAATAFGLKPHEMSGVVQTQFGVHLILATDRRPGRDEVRGRAGGRQGGLLRPPPRAARQSTPAGREDHHQPAAEAVIVSVSNTSPQRQQGRPLLALRARVARRTHPMRTVLLLICSNAFMTLAWYGHLRFKNSAVVVVILVSWLIALPEYAFQVPANRIGYFEDKFTPSQLKIIQEVISIATFVVLSYFYLSEVPTWRTALAFLLILAAVVLVVYRPDKQPPPAEHAVAAVTAPPH